MRIGRTALIVFGALIITALGIDAADTISGDRGTLLSQVMQSAPSACPDDMVAVRTIPTVSCVDRYEVSTERSFVFS